MKNRSFVKFKGFKICQAIHPEIATKGESAVIIKNTCHYEENKFGAKNIQPIVMKIVTKNSNRTLTSVYVLQNTTSNVADMKHFSKI